MAQGGGGPLDQVLGPIPDTGGPPWVETRGPEGGKGMVEHADPGACFSCSVRWRALTIPTGIEPAITKLINLISACSSCALFGPKNSFEPPVDTVY